MKTTKLFTGAEPLLRCPVCKGALHLEQGRSLLCPSGHCFDLSAKGYVNFLSGKESVQENYDKALFSSRKAIFSAGYYQRVFQELEQCLESYVPERQNRTILDVGCGEGYYANAFSQNPQNNVFALDNVKEAILLACQGPTRVKWMVANLANIPMADGCVDMLCNILTPANYQEFTRLLGPDGILVKAIPGEEYLLEIRQRAFHDRAYSNAAVVNHFQEQMELLERKEIHDTLPVTQEELAHFVRMTPMTYRIDTSGIVWDGIEAITIHMELLMGRAKKD